jgi:hypothetical protein
MNLVGTYGFVYCGDAGVGIGVFSINSGGEVTGCDFAGGRYRGHAHEQANGEVLFDVVFVVAPGMATVTGTAPQDISYTRPIKHTFPANFGDGAPQDVGLPPSEVTIMIKRVPDDFADAAIHGFPRRAPTLAQGQSHWQPRRSRLRRLHAW